MKAVKRLQLTVVYMSNFSLNILDEAMTIVEQAMLIASIPERENFIQSRCRDNRELRAKVARLLSADSSNAAANKAVLRDAPAAFPAAGDRIGKYQIERKIGEGLTGVIYKAFVKTEIFSRAVAIKVLKPNIADLQPGGLAYEAAILSRVNHPGVPQPHDFGETENRLPYFAMDFVEGDTLDDYCRVHRLTVKQRLVLFVQICEIVTHLHKKGIVHRDIKPSNILVNSDAAPRLVDFGFAKLESESLGIADPDNFFDSGLSYDYCSPEHLQEFTTDFRSDIYSLGATLYFLVAGLPAHRLPDEDWNESNPAEIRRKIIGDEIQAPAARLAVVDAERLNKIAAERNTSARRLSKTLDANLNGILARALEKSPTARYQTVEILKRDVENFLSRQPITARENDWRYRLYTNIVKIFARLPPAGVDFRYKVLFVAALLFALLIPLFARGVSFASAYYSAASAPDAATIPLSAGNRKKLAETETKLQNFLASHLYLEQREQALLKQRGAWQNASVYNSWTWAQMTVALKNKSLSAAMSGSAADAFTVDEVRAQLFNSTYAVTDGNRLLCFSETDAAIGGRCHFGATSTILLAAGAYNLKADDALVEHVLKWQHADGWWSIFGETAAGKQNVPGASSACTFSTALFVWALDLHRKRGLISPAQQPAAQAAIERGRAWLLAQTSSPARWKDYPHNPSGRESVAVSGLVLTVLHQTADADSAARLREIDGAWLDKLSDVSVNPTKMEAVDRDSNTRDPSRYALVAWAIIATATAYPNGTTWQKTAAVEWTNEFVERFETSAGELFVLTPYDHQWLRSELFIALRVLNGDHLERILIND